MRRPIAATTVAMLMGCATVASLVAPLASAEDDVPAVAAADDSLPNTAPTAVDDDAAPADARELQKRIIQYNTLFSINADFYRLRERKSLLDAFLLMQVHRELTGMSARTPRALWRNRHRIDADLGRAERPVRPQAAVPMRDRRVPRGLRALRLRAGD